MPPQQRRTPNPDGAAASPRRRRRRPLTWIDIGDGHEIPDCMECQRLLSSPMFMEAVYSTSIEYPTSPDELARSAVNAYHDHDHAEA